MAVCLTAPVKQFSFVYDPVLLPGHWLGTADHACYRAVLRITVHVRITPDRAVVGKCAARFNASLAVDETVLIYDDSAGISEQTHVPCAGTLFSNIDAAVYEQ